MQVVTRLNGDQAAYDESLTPRDALINDYILSEFGAPYLHRPGTRAQVAQMIEETRHFYIIDTGENLIGVRKDRKPFKI